MYKLVFLVLLLVPGYAPAAELHLAAAASLRELAAEAASRFEAQTGHRVLVNTASSGTLARQIAAGAPADLFLSANPQWMDYLVGKGTVAEGRPVVWAANRLAVVGRGPALKDLEALRSFSRLSIGSPDSTPVGRYARSMLMAAGIYGELIKAKRLVFAKDVRQALAHAEQGVVDAAIVYASDTRLLQKAAVLLIPAAALQPDIRYPIALTVSGEKKSGARKLFEQLTSDQGAALLDTYGFAPLKGRAE